MPSTSLIYLKKLLHHLGPVIVTGIFSIAVWLLYKEIKRYSLDDIRMSLALISTPTLLISILLTAINYIILIGYDWLALKAIHKKLAFSKVALVSFVGQAISFNLGAVLGGTPVRYRFYSVWGFAPLDIVRLILILALAFWIGAMGLIGILFLIAPPHIPIELAVYIPFQDVRPLGILLVFIALSYWITCAVCHKPIHIFGKEFSFPSIHIALAQALVSGADLIVAGACLYNLLPHDPNLSFIEFLPNYLLAMVIAVLSHVPGGAGVLEVIILHLVSTDPKNIFAALICYRAIYYLLPLITSACVFGIYELFKKRT